MLRVRIIERCALIIQSFSSFGELHLLASKNACLHVGTYLIFTSMYVSHMDRLISGGRATSNNLRLTLNVVVTRGWLECWKCNCAYVASNFLVARRFFTVTLFWVIMELDRRTKCNLTLSARRTNGLNEVGKISRCRYLNRPSVESLDEKSHNGHRLIDWTISSSSSSSSDWERADWELHWLEKLCWFTMLDNPSRNHLHSCRPELLCDSTIKLLAASDQTIDRWIRTGWSRHCEYGV